LKAFALKSGNCRKITLKVKKRTATIAILIIMFLAFSAVFATPANADVTLNLFPPGFGWDNGPMVQIGTSGVCSYETIVFLWGDGALTSGYSGTLTHTYSTFGSYAISVIATDFDGATVQASTIITMSPNGSVATPWSFRQTPATHSIEPDITPTPRKSASPTMLPWDYQSGSNVPFIDMVYIVGAIALFDVVVFVLLLYTRVGAHKSGRILGAATFIAPVASFIFWFFASYYNQPHPTDGTLDPAFSLPEVIPLYVALGAFVAAILLLLIARGPVSSQEERKQKGLEKMS
jgi:hypothetical protein